MFGTLRRSWTPFLLSLDFTVERMMKAGKLKDQDYSVGDAYLSF